MRADHKTEAGVLIVIEEFLDYLMKRDVEGMLPLFAIDADAVFYAPDSIERCLGLSEILAKISDCFKGYDNIAYKFSWFSVSNAENVAWMSADLKGNAVFGGQASEFPIRLTSVLEKRDNRWLILQMNLSFAAK